MTAKQSLTPLEKNPTANNVCETDILRISVGHLNTVRGLKSRRL
jgi:hypothetical protein